MRGYRKGEKGVPRLPKSSRRQRLILRIQPFPGPLPEQVSELTGSAGFVLRTALYHLPGSQVLPAAAPQDVQSSPLYRQETADKGRLPEVGASLRRGHHPAAPRGEARKETGPFRPDTIDSQPCPHCPRVVSLCPPPPRAGLGSAPEAPTSPRAPRAPNKWRQAVRTDAK